MIRACFLALTMEAERRWFDRWMKTDIEALLASMQHFNSSLTLEEQGWGEACHYQCFIAGNRSGGCGWERCTTAFPKPHSVVVRVWKPLNNGFILVTNEPTSVWKCCATAEALWRLVWLFSFQSIQLKRPKNITVFPLFKTGSTSTQQESSIFSSDW